MSARNLHRKHSTAAPVRRFALIERHDDWKKMTDSVGACGGAPVEAPYPAAHACRTLLTVLATVLHVSRQLASVPPVAPVVRVPAYSSQRAWAEPPSPQPRQPAQPKLPPSHRPNRASPQSASACTGPFVSFGDSSRTAGDIQVVFALRWRRGTLVLVAVARLARLQQPA